MKLASSPAMATPGKKIYQTITKIPTQQKMPLTSDNYIYIVTLKSTRRAGHNNVLPGTTATVFSARNTRKVLRAARFPNSMNIVMYL